MKKIIFCCFLLISIKTFAQNTANVLKMDVPAIAMGERQDFRVITYEPISAEEYSILYLQELPASIIGEREFGKEDQMGAYIDSDLKNFVNRSNRVLILVRQTFGKTGDPVTNFWVVALRELQSEMKYTMVYPPNFVHPIIKNGVEVNYSLKNLDQIKGLTEHEFEALTQIGKSMYGFYTYTERSYSSKRTDILDDIKSIKSGFKSLKALGKGDIPENEKILFKREVVDNIRIAATKIEKKDSVIVKLYLCNNAEANYEMVKSQTFLGEINPSFATTLVYDKTLKVSGAYGYVHLKYKDANGESKANPLAIGIDNNGDPQFWRLDAGKNSLRSFNPMFSYMDEDGVYVISLNQEKIFKPYYQHHLLKMDASATTLYPTNEAEINSEKSEFVYTEQEKKAYAGGSATGTSSKEEFPVGIVNIKKSRFLLTAIKTRKNEGSVMVTSYGNISVMQIDGDKKIKLNNIIAENQSIDLVYPKLLGEYSDKAYYMVNYPNKFMLVFSEDKMEIASVENKVYRLVNTATQDYMVSNQFGSMFLTKSIIGNKYILEFFPSN